MAERRNVRTKRRPGDDDRAEVAGDELAEEPDDELADDELADEPAEEELAEEDSRQASRNDCLTAAKAGQAALRQIAELTGKDPEGVTGVEPAEDGWLVGVEVVEDRRIPSSTDILATYETEIDAGGDLVSYRRVRRYPRGRGDDEDT